MKATTKKSQNKFQSTSKQLTQEEENEVNEYLKTRTDFMNRPQEYANHCPQLAEVGIQVKCKNSKQKELIESIKTNEITIAAGPAGTGKTYLACVEALKLIKSDPAYKTILLVKSVNGLEDEDIGFLPGDTNEKLGPHMMSYMANFHKIIGEKKTDELYTNGIIKFAPLFYIRGASIDNAIILIDETQNITINNIRTVMTRLGSNSKMIFLGDIKQIDLKKKERSSLPYLIKNFSSMDEIGTIEFTKKHIVRNPLIQKIEDIFDNNEY